jgi:hypothetical protein
LEVLPENGLGDLPQFLPPVVEYSVKVTANLLRRVCVFSRLKVGCL